MKISILVPIYGVERYIERCARSLLSQGYPDIEYIFVDDASPDRSIEILGEVLAEYPGRDVKIVTNQRNMGLAGTRNVAVNHATGDYILHVDSDDYIAPDAVAALAEKARDSGADIVVFDSVDLYDDSERVHRIRFDYSTKQDYIRAILWRQTRLSLWTKLLRRELYRHVRAVPGMDYGEDFYALPQLVYYASSVAKLDQPLYFYMRSNPDAISRSLSPAKADHAILAAERLAAFFESVPDAEIYRPMIGQMKIRNKIGILQAGGIATWKHVEGLYDDIDYSGFGLRTSPRLILWLHKHRLWTAMRVYIAVAKLLKRR